MPTRHRTSFTALEQQVERLTRDLDEARHQQRATVEVLQAISHSTFDVGPVFETVVKHAMALCAADVGSLHTFDGETYRLAVAFGGSDKHRALLAQSRIRPGRGTLVGKVGLERRTVQIVDVLQDPDYSWQELLQLDELGTMLGVPMLHGEPIGVIVVLRQEVRAVYRAADRGVDHVCRAGGHRDQQRSLSSASCATVAASWPARSMSCKALGEVGQAVSSTLEVSQVLTNDRDLRDAALRDRRRVDL